MSNVGDTRTSIHGALTWIRSPAYLLPMASVLPSLVLALGFVVAGCVSLTPQQQDRVAEDQRFADATTTAYDLPRIRHT